MSQYDSLSVDPELAAKVSSLFRSGMWPSRRALYHDLIRRGLMEILGSGLAQMPVSLTSLPQPSLPVPSAPPSTVGGPADAGASHRTRGRGGRPPRRDATAKKADIEGAGSAAEAPNAGAHASIPPQPAPSGGDVSRAPAASAPAIPADTESSWVCPACGGTFPLEERWVHKPRCARRTSAAPETRPPQPSPPQTPPSPGPGIDLERLRRRVLDSLRDAGRSANPRDYLVALVQRAAEEQGVPEASEAEASQIVRELARREPQIGRIFEKVVG